MAINQVKADRYLLAVTLDRLESVCYLSADVLGIGQLSIDELAIVVRMAGIKPTRFRSAAAIAKNLAMDVARVEECLALLKEEQLVASSKNCCASSMQGYVATKKAKDLLRAISFARYLDPL